MRFGEPVDEDRLAALLRPGGGIDTVMTADAYGAGEADALLGRALDGRARARTTAWSGAIGHDFYRGRARRARRASRASPTRGCAAPDGYADYVRMATERSLERCGADALRPPAPTQPGPHRLHQRGGVGRAGGRCATTGWPRALGVAPGPANGFTLDLIDCFERFGERIDWAMVILNPLEPWPGELVLDAARRHDVQPHHARRRLRRPVPRRRAARPPVRRATTTARSGRRAGSSAGASSSTGCGRSPSATA